MQQKRIWPWSGKSLLCYHGNAFKDLKAACKANSSRKLRPARKEAVPLHFILLDHIHSLGDSEHLLIH